MEYYTPYSTTAILQSHHPEFLKNNKSEQIMNEAVSFDIETTSTYTIKKKKIAFMYCWMFDIFDKTIFGRTWEEFIQVLKTISKYYRLSKTKRIVIFVHNLSYEFQFLRLWFQWTKVFATEKRKPLSCINSLGFEFRCSYRLSGYKLSKIGEDMGIEKLPDFDYSIIRTHLTELTPREKEYCIHDVKIVSAYIRKLIKDENGIIHIPLTATGFVRRLYRSKCIYSNHSFRYREIVKTLTLTPEEYKRAKKAFAGGFTHSSFLHSREVHENVWSFDFSSSYPAVLVAEKYPMTKGVEVKNISMAEFYKRIERCCCVFTIEMLDVIQRDDFVNESYISRSRCILCEEPVENNGRIWSAKRIMTTITNVDFEIIRKVYDCKGGFRVSNFWYYEKAYLPDEFIETLMELYHKKTTLKNVVGKEDEYMRSKGDINASFGMAVTDIVRKVIEYNDGEWIEEEEMTLEEINSQITQENNKKNRFLFYLWGVFCTAYARRNLFYGIYECKEDYLYSDTDSVKIINPEKHLDFINKYNAFITHKIEVALQYHGLPLDYARPKTIEGVEKPLGIWECDGKYLRFKAIRAKSYMYYYFDTKKNKYIMHMTQAGVNGEKAAEYLQLIAKTVSNCLESEPENNSLLETVLDEYGKTALRIYFSHNKNWKLKEIVITLADGTEYDRISVSKRNSDEFNLFDFGMKIPPVFTGKLTHTYCDSEFFEQITDCQNHVCIVHEKSFVHLEPQDYELSDGRDYADFIRGIRIFKRVV